MAETFKLSVEEEKKLGGIFSLLENIEKTQVSHEILDIKKDKLVSVIHHLMTPLGREIANAGKSQAKITEQLEDPVVDDLFATDPVFIEVTHFIEHSHTKFLFQEQLIQLLATFISDSLAFFNDMTPTKTSKRTSAIDDGTPMLNDAERERFRRTAHTLVLNYKHEKTLSKKRTVASRLLYLADSKEKYDIVNDIFLDLVGEKVLDKIKKQKGADEHQPA